MPAVPGGLCWLCLSGIQLGDVKLAFTAACLLFSATVGTAFRLLPVFFPLPFLYLIFFSDWVCASHVPNKSPAYQLLISFLQPRHGRVGVFSSKNSLRGFTVGFVIVPVGRLFGISLVFEKKIRPVHK